MKEEKSHMERRMDGLQGKAGNEMKEVCKIQKRWADEGRDSSKGYEECRCERYECGWNEKWEGGYEGPLQTIRGPTEGGQDGEGGREEGYDKGRGAICLDLKGRAIGVGEDTEEEDDWALMITVQT